MTTTWQPHEPLIRWRLKDKKKSAYGLSQYLGLSESYTSQLIKGRRRCDIVTLNRIASYLEIDPAFLMAPVEEADAA